MRMIGLLPRVFAKGKKNRKKTIKIKTKIKCFEFKASLKSKGNTRAYDFKAPYLNFKSARLSSCFAQSIMVLYNNTLPFYQQKYRPLGRPLQNNYI